DRLGQRGVQELLGPGRLRYPIPHRLLFDVLNSSYASFAAPSPLHHALQAFEEMKTVGVWVAVKNGNGMLRPRAPFEIDARGPEGDGNRRARHQRKLQLASDLH